MSKEKIRKLNQTCEITVEFFDVFHTYSACGRRAEYRTPKDLISGNQYYVCGIHRRSIDIMYRNLGNHKRCKKLDEAGRKEKIDANKESA